MTPLITSRRDQPFGVASGFCVSAIRSPHEKRASPLAHRVRQCASAHRPIPETERLYVFPRPVSSRGTPYARVRNRTLSAGGSPAQLRVCLNPEFQALFLVSSRETTSVKLANAG